MNIQPINNRELLDLDIRYTVENANGQAIGVVFFDEEWEGFGWMTEAFTNGPFDSVTEARKALKDEIGPEKP